MRHRTLLTLAATALLGILPLAAQDDVTVTGEIVDSACFIKMGARGEGHRECAQQCADAGIPLALVEDGTGNVIWLAAKQDATGVNPLVRDHAAHRVTVTGKMVERGGAKLLVVDSVSMAS
jgi:hypothetical protein